MLRALAWALQAAVLALIAYNLVTALWGWPTPSPAPRGVRRTRFRVLVPAHDEQAVITGILTDLAAQDHPAELVEVVVVADRCNDDTVALARPLARVIERTEGAPGKGPALRSVLVAEPLTDGEALVVLDADNRIPPDLLTRFADEIDAGHHALQAYLDVLDPDGSLLVTASALTYWAGNRMVQLARSNLAWSADLGGTGMCLTATAMTAIGGYGDSLTEDQELGVRLVVAGHRVTWLHDVKVRDEKPSDLGVAVLQRARWMAGKREVARTHVRSLLTAARAQRSWAPLDMVLRLLQPGRSFVALLSGLLTVLAGILDTPLLLPWPVWAATTLVQVLAPLPFLARDGVEPRYLARYPLATVIAALWIPVRIMSRGARAAAWYHTPHSGSPSGSQTGSPPGDEPQER